METIPDFVVHDQGFQNKSQPGQQSSESFYNNTYDQITRENNKKFIIKEMLPSESFNIADKEEVGGPKEINTMENRINAIVK